MVMFHPEYFILKYEPVSHLTLTADRLFNTSSTGKKNDFWICSLLLFLFIQVNNPDIHVLLMLASVWHVQISALFDNWAGPLPEAAAV